MATEVEGIKIFVGGLSWETKDDDLRTAFEKFGSIESAEVIVHRDTQRSRGFGFVTFENKDDAEKAISEMTGTELQGREIRCDYASAKGNGGGRREGGGSFRRSGPYERRDGGRDYDRRGGYDRREGGRRDYEGGGRRDYEGGGRRDYGGGRRDYDKGRDFERRDRRD